MSLSVVWKRGNGRLNTRPMLEKYMIVSKVSLRAGADDVEEDSDADGEHLSRHSLLIKIAFIKYKPPHSILPSVF